MPVGRNVDLGRAAGKSLIIESGFTSVNPNLSTQEPGVTAEYRFERANRLPINALEQFSWNRARLVADYQPFALVPLECRRQAFVTSWHPSRSNKPIFGNPRQDAHRTFITKNPGG